MSFKQLVVIITGLYSRTELHHRPTQPEIRSTFFRRMLTSSSHTRLSGHQTDLIQTQSIMLYGGALLEKVYRGRKFTAVELLRLAIIKEWRNLSQRIIDRSINEWHQRLEKVVKKQRGQTERVFWLSKYLSNNCIWQNNYINLIIWNNYYIFIYLFMYLFLFIYCRSRI